MSFPTRHHHSNTWLTPPHILQPLGAFDTDPCAPEENPAWANTPTAYTETDNGLIQPWEGRVWLNPPYGRGIEKWLQRMAEHTTTGNGSGIALIFARTDTKAWQHWVFPYAHSILWVAGRLTFYTPAGEPGPTSAAAPSALIGYTPQDTKALAGSGIAGAHTILKHH